MTAPVLELLDAAIAETRRQGRGDLASRLENEREQMTAGAWHVLVAGEFKKGKSSFINALLNLPVCGTDPVTFGAVPTIISYGGSASAALVLDGPDDLSRRRRAISLRSAGGYALSGFDDDGA